MDTIYLIFYGKASIALGLVTNVRAPSQVGVTNISLNIISFYIYIFLNPKQTKLHGY